MRTLSALLFGFTLCTGALASATPQADSARNLAAAKSTHSMMSTQTAALSSRLRSLGPVLAGHRERAQGYKAMHAEVSANGSSKAVVDHFATLAEKESIAADGMKSHMQLVRAAVKSHRAETKRLGDKVQALELEAQR